MKIHSISISLNAINSDQRHFVRTLRFIMKILLNLSTYCVVSFFLPLACRPYVCPFCVVLQDILQVLRLLPVKDTQLLKSQVISSIIRNYRKKVKPLMELHHVFHPHKVPMDQQILQDPKGHRFSFVYVYQLVF